MLDFILSILILFLDMSYEHDRESGLTRHPMTFITGACGIVEILEVKTHLVEVSTVALVSHLLEPSLATGLAVAFSLVAPSALA